MKNKLIINLTPTVMIPTKEMTQNVPVAPDEIIADVLGSAALGASMVHLHARDDMGRQAYDPRIFRKIIGGIREARSDLVICVTTSGRTYPELEKRALVLDLEDDLKPDMASLTLSSLNFNKQASVNEPETIKRLAAKMVEKDIKPELEAFDLGMINYAKYLIDRNLLKPPYFFVLLFGNIACAQANLLSVGLMINELPKDSVVCLGGVGKYQKFINSLAVISGYNVRVGLEDNIWYDDERSVLATNQMLVKRVVDVAKAHGIEIATPAEARELIGLRKA
jgi:3-keto-5-aminohexanoate cleavage enzyme